QGSSLFLLIRSSFDILSHRFSLVKNFFIFLFAVCFGFFLPHKSAYLDYHIRFPLSRTFSFRTVVCSRPLLPYGLAAGSFLWSASATSGILSRKK
ncbi:MAG: hypothetical protein ACLS8T_39345, partial [Anaerobutyricum sp.]